MITEKGQTFAIVDDASFLPRGTYQITDAGDVGDLYEVVFQRVLPGFS